MAQQNITKHKYVIFYSILIVSFLVTLCSTYLLQNLYGNENNVQFFIRACWVNITFMGDAFFAATTIISLFAFFNKRGLAIKLLVTISIALLFVQIIKNITSESAFHLFFEANSYEGNYINVTLSNSISSHSVVAITLAYFFISEAKSMYVKIALVMGAFLVSCSRLFVSYDSFFAIAVAVVPGLVSVILVQLIYVKLYMLKNYVKIKRRYTPQVKNNSYLSV